MKTSRTLLLAALAPFAACAPQTFRVDAGVMVSNHNGDVALQDAGGSLELGQERNNLDSLGLGSTRVSPYLRMQWDHDAHRIRGTAFGFEEKGHGEVDGNFGGIASGSAVDATMDFFAGTVGYTYGLLQTLDFRVGVGGQMGTYLQNIAMRSTGGREEVETEVLVPMPCVDVEFYLGDLFTVGGDLGLMYADLRDGTGRYIDGEVWARYQVTKELDLLAGYRYLVLDAKGEATDRDFDADVNVRGLFVGGGIKF